MTENIISQSIACYEQVIPSDLIDLMLKEIDNIPSNNFFEGEIGMGEDFVIEKNTRNSKISWWEDSHWVSSIFSHYFNRSNRENWEYDISGVESIQVSTYGPKDHYSWHCDYGTSKNKYTRKLSASLLVTDSSEYEGGDLEFIDYHGNLITAPKEKGTIVIFDSRVPHRVTPVIWGKRLSLVSWMLGPKLK